AGTTSRALCISRCAHPRHPHSFPTRRSSDLRETVQDSTETANAGQTCDLLIVVGGDGTIRLAAREAIARDIPIYHYPFGTENLLDRKSTRLNSSHVKISYAVFCLKKKTRRRS